MEVATKHLHFLGNPIILCTCLLWFHCCQTDLICIQYFISAVVITWFGNVHSGKAEPSVENCTHKEEERGLKISCTLIGFTDIPQDIPDETFWLFIGEAELTMIRAYTFYQQGYASNLYFLGFYKNNISIIEDASFYGLVNLKYLVLKRNNIASLRRDMFLGLDHLEQVYLQRNFITAIVPGTFDWLTSANYLWIQINRMSTLDSRVLSNQQRPLKQFGLNRFVNCDTAS